MNNIFIEYPNCSTCKKAKRWLENNNIDFIDRNILKETPTFEELDLWIKISNKDIKRYFNTSGLEYRKMNLKDNLNNMSYEEKLKLLSSNGMLIKRPLLIIKDDILVGFKEEEWENKLLKNKIKKYF